MGKYEPLMKEVFWRWITNTWCLVSFATIIYDFVYDHSLGDLLPSVLVVYVALLTIFVGLKEFERWFEVHEGRHPGELFVIGWTILMVGLVIGKTALHKDYSIPGEVISTYIAVISIMAITQKSKRLKSRRKYAKARGK